MTTQYVTTYGATHGDARLAQSISLCDEHDTADHRCGYAKVDHGHHAERVYEDAPYACTVCIDSALANDASDRTTAEFSSGDRVSAGFGDDHDTGTVRDPSPGEIAIPHTASAVWVAWDSGVSTWTPRGDLAPL